MKNYAVEICKFVNSAMENWEIGNDDEGDECQEIADNVAKEIGASISWKSKIDEIYLRFGEGQIAILRPSFSINWVKIEGIVHANNIEKLLGRE